MKQPSDQTLSPRIRLQLLTSGTEADTSLLNEAARAHADDSDDPDYEVGDLQEYLRVAVEVMSVDQRCQFYADARVRELFAFGFETDM